MRLSMKDEKGVALPTLLFIILLIIIVAVFAIKYVKEMLNETEIQDLRTDMLVVQAEAKKDLEKVRFQTANLDENKEEDKEKIAQAKQENLKRILVKGSDIEKNVPQEIEIDDNCYYLNNEDLKDIGIQNYSIDKYGYIIVKYDFKNTMVEVISTKGYNGKHTLTQLIDD